MSRSDADEELLHHALERRRLLRGLVAMPWVGTLAACGGRTPSADSTATAPSSTTPAPASARSFVHPGLPHSEADFARMRQKVEAAAEPWLSGWNALLSGGYANLGSVPNPQATVIRGGTGQNFGTMVLDMERTYQLALRWKVSGDTAYADLAVRYLDAWSSTMTTLTGNADRFIAAGLYGYQWANAAEIMRSYSGWSADGIARFQRLLLEVFYPLSHDFLVNHNGADITNYWASWDLLSICGVMAIGVFCDRVDLYDEAMNYYKTGRGNGAAAHAVYCLHPGHLGQWQESGRDQGHTTLSISLAASLCEMAWSQGDDLYGYRNNRLLSGAEYVAASNLADAAGNYASLPFSLYVNRQGTMTTVSTAGRPHLRPCWEAIYNHYVNRRGLSAPYVTAMAAKLRPERLDAGGDEPSFGTLTYSRDALAVGAAPSGLTAHLTAGAVALSWWGSAQASAYEVQRASAAAGPFTTLASVGETRSHTDAPASGSWYYRVVAVSGSQRLTGIDTLRVAVPGELRLHLPLDDGSGTTARDGGGFGASGTLVNGASWGAGRSGGSALALDGTGGHLALPNGVMQDLGDFTIALWVYWPSAQSGNSRVFDFGSSDIAYFGLMPGNGSSPMRCMFTGTTWYGEQNIVAAGALPTGRWVHLAVTLSGTTGTLYVDGAVSGSNTAVQLAPFQLGATTQNWLGRAQYASDPFFNGRMQDLRLYSGALTAEQVAALAV